jgi:hypothetical protein
VKLRSLWLGDGNGPASIARPGAFGTPGYWPFYPSTITTPNGYRLFIYTASSSSIYPSVWYANQSLTGSTALANGTSFFGTSGVSAWGDYQSAWLDAGGGTGNVVWITGEFAKSTNVWGTKFDLVTP